MSKPDRRRFLKGALLALVQAAGSVVLASTVAPGTPVKPAPEKEPSAEDLQQRADQLAGNEEDASLFLTGSGPLSANGPREAGWVNGWVNGWNNGSFRNGGWSNGGWANGWKNGWVNGGFRKR